MFFNIGYFMKILCTLWDIVSANPALDVALIALVFAVWQGWRIHKHNKLSVRPVLKIDVSNGARGDRGHYRLKLVNCGIGPAVIKDVKLLFAGYKISHNNVLDYKTFIHEKLEKFAICEIRSIMPKDVLVMGGEKNLWDFDYNPEIHTGEEIDEIRKIGLLIEYESFYEEKLPRLEHKKGKFIG